MAIIRINNELNGIEILFENKPESGTIAALKENGFRWSPKNKLWYAKQTAERVSFAESLGDLSTAPAPIKKDVINLDNLGVIPENFTRHGAELAKFIREDLKKRGVKGVTVRARSITYDTGITVTVKATAEDLASMEEAAERFTFSRFACEVDSRNGVYTNGRWLYVNEWESLTDEQKEAEYYIYLSEQIKKTNEFYKYHHNRGDCWTFSTAFYNKCLAIFQIANQWNYDHSDSMTDYFDVGYYLDIDIKTPEDLTPRATMTEDERKSLQDERAKEEADFLSWQKQQEEERQKAKEEAEKYNNWAKESNEIILNDITVEDLEENEQLFVSKLVGGYGKESTLEELKEDAEKAPHNNCALVTRKVIFHSSEALDRFYKMLLHDFDFLAGKGGTATEDTRINSGEDFYKLNEDQRESVFFYSSDCVGIYHNDRLVLVVDPQGYNYARYTYLADNCTIEEAPAKLAHLRGESEELPRFYFPAPVTEQINNISVGDNITVWQCDGWILNKVLDGFGTVTAITPGDYAQYKGVYIDLQQGRKQKRVFIRDNHDCLIYKGINVLLPEEVTSRRINDRMRELYNYDVLIPNIYNYFKTQGLDPVVDTWQR